MRQVITGIVGLKTFDIREEFVFDQSNSIKIKIKNLKRKNEKNDWLKTFDFAKIFANNVYSTSHIPLK